VPPLDLDPYWGDWGPPAPQPQPATDAEDDSKAFAAAALVGGALIALGSFLPWITSVTPYGTISHTGMDGGNSTITDGIILLLCGVSIASTGIRWLAGAKGKRPRGERGWVAFSAIIAGVIGGIDMHLTWVNANDYVQQYYPNATAYLGPGLYTIIIGALIALPSVKTT
jgi:hypothetical protein